MIVEETFEVAAPAQYVYDQVSNVGDIGYCIAGVQTVTVVNDRESDWLIEQRFGAMARRFRLHATMVEAESPSRIAFTAKGQDVDVSGHFEIEQIDEQSSRCSVTLEIEVVGPLAPLVELFAKGPQQALIRKTVDNVRTKLETGAVPGAAPSVDPTAASAVGSTSAGTSPGEPLRLFGRIRVWFGRLFRRGSVGEA
jgi:carbon monoxide dehydrogenase subunit G